MKIICVGKCVNLICVAAIIFESQVLQRQIMSSKEFRRIAVNIKYIPSLSIELVVVFVTPSSRLDLLFANKF